jgi:cytochrome c553
MSLPLSLQSKNVFLATALIATASMALFSGSGAMAFPEYQQFVEKHSGRTANCSMCHTNDSGPTGNDAGQIGSLTEAKLKQLNEARAAFEPGQDVDNPILNKFGNAIVKKIGMKNVLQYRSDPEKLATALGGKDDLDGDGIADSREFLDGTDPLNASHGDPWLLFVHNFSRYRVHIALAVLSIGLLLYGFNKVIAALSSSMEKKK